MSNRLLPRLLTIGIVLPLSVLAGCAQKRAVASVAVTVPAATAAIEPVDPNSWAAIVSVDDATRLQRLDAAWASALADAHRRNARAIAVEGALLSPTGALPRVQPSPGRYRCRVVTLGRGEARRAPPFARFPAQTCFVAIEGDLLLLMKATGTTLPGGRLWTDSDTRMVFLGAMAPRPGAAAPGYGGDATRDRAGVLERVGDFRWRLVTPWTSGGPTLEVMELVPEPDAPPAP